MPKIFYPGETPGRDGVNAPSPANPAIYPIGGRKSRLGLSPGKGGGYTLTDPQAQAYYARLGTTYPSHHLQALDTFIIGLKAAGIWSAMDVICDHAARSGATGGVMNMKGAAGDFTTAGTLTWSRSGVKGDGSTGYLIGINPTTFGGNFQRDSHSIWQFAKEPSILGNDYTVGTNNSSYGPRMRAAQVTSNLYFPSGYSGNGATISSDVQYRKSKPTPILFGMNRKASNVLDLWECDQKTATETTATTGLVNMPIWLLRQINTYSTTPVSMTMMGGSISDSQVATFWQLVRDYIVNAYRGIALYANSLGADQPAWNSGGGSIRTPKRWSDVLEDELGVPVYNQGYSGQLGVEIKDRFVADKFCRYARPLLWLFRNNVANADSSIRNPANMMTTLGQLLAATARTDFIIMDEINGHYPTEVAGATDYLNIQSINNLMKGAYPGHILPIREIMVATGAPTGAYPDATFYPTDQLPLVLQEPYQSGQPAVHLTDLGALTVVKDAVKGAINGSVALV